MKLGFLLLSDAAEALNGKLYVLGGGWSVLRLPLPQDYGFSIGLGIDVPWEGTNQKHSMELIIEDPDGNQVADEPFTGEFEVGRPPGIIPGSDQRLVIALSGRFHFEREGPHAVVVRIDGADVEGGRSRFYLHNLPAPPGT